MIIMIVITIIIVIMIIMIIVIIVVIRLIVMIMVMLIVIIAGPAVVASATARGSGPCNLICGLCLDSLTSNVNHGSARAVVVPALRKLRIGIGVLDVDVARYGEPLV